MLRPFVAADAAAVQRLAGDPLISDTTLNIPHPYADGIAEAWIPTHETEWREGRSVTFAIEGDGELRGAIRLTLTPAHRRAEVGYWISRAWWGRGIATEAVRAMIAFAFGRLDLNRVQATHFVRNPASGRVMEKCGMIREGTHREKFMKSGRFEDVVEYAILRSDRDATAR